MNLHTVSNPDSLTNNEMVRLENVFVRYRIPSEQIATFKEYAIRWLQRKVGYQDFMAVNGISFNVHRGEVLGLVGHNGAGKSTLLKLVAKVLVPTKGRVLVKGKVAPLLEFGAGFHPELTGRENVYLNGALLGFTRTEMDEKFDRIVEFAELSDFIDAPMRTYSSGMWARLGFAVATDVQPDVLIVDEILSVGDASFQEKSLARMKSFHKQGAAILLVSHNLDMVKEMCHRVVWIDHGNLLREGDPEEIVTAYQEAHVRR